MTFLHKKWVPAGTLTFVNLKSNTMKNTLQRYDYNRFLPSFSSKKSQILTFFSQSSPFRTKIALKNHHLSVVCHLNIRWQFLIHHLMQSDIVTRMDQISLFRPHPPSKGDGIIHQLMRVMGLVEA